jgi:mRNA interferase RelE/StbE
VTWQVSLSNQARKFLRDLRDARLRERLEREIDALAINPRPPGMKQLTASDGILRVRVGDHRILYAVKDAELLVLVVKIAHRREVYR